CDVSLHKHETLQATSLPSGTETPCPPAQQMRRFPFSGSKLMHRIATLLVTLFTLSLAAPAQQPRPAAPPSTAPAEKPAEKKEAEKKEPEPEMREEPPVVTQHEIRIAGRVLRYTATAGKLPIKNAEGNTEAQMFFIAYTAENPGGKSRPLMFSFNGGPGSSSVWLHLGALGPRRVHMLPDGGMPKPPFELVDNDQTWLD